MNSTMPLLLTGLLLALPTLLCAADTKSPPPNIVVILADDFGVGDIQAHYPKNKIPTPHLDRLVRQGMSFMDAHSSSAVCSPTRYGLLTGRYNWRTRLQEWVIAAYEPPLIAEGRPTLPGFLRDNGYRTACIGKWHLGWEWPGPQPSRMTEKRNGQAFFDWDFTRPIAGGPTKRGFDYYFGVDLPNLPPFTYIENDRVVTRPTEKFQPDRREGVVLPTRFAGTPAAPDWRMQDILPEITRRAVTYVHEQAKQDKPFFLYFSMTSPHEPIVPSAKFRGKSGIAPIADFVMETDWSTGQVIQAIDDAGIADNTLVIFTADNGHSHYTGWEQLVEAGHMPSGPYRGHKGDIWEGGHRVPLVARWPRRVEAATRSDQMICLTDVFATCAQILGKDLPTDGAEDSLSFLPALLGTASDERRTTLVNHSNHGEFAYRDGPWKLVFKMGGRNLEQSRGKATVVELYNLASDISERRDLAKQRPEVVRQMTSKLKELIDRGSSRANQKASNDTLVRFDTIQTKRWATATKSPNDEKVQSVIDELDKLCRDQTIYMIGPTKAKRLAELVRRKKPKLVVECGTAVGYSGLWIARELQAIGQGKLITIEIDESRAKQAKANFAKAGLADIVEVRVGDARQLVREIKQPVDFLFIDCNFSNYGPCFAGIEDQLEVGAVVVADNVGVGAGSMKDYLDVVRTKYNSTTERFDIDLPWGKRDAMEITIIRQKGKE